MNIKQCKQFYYRIQDGDNLMNLCERFNTTKENIIRNNERLDLYVGEWVIVKTNDFKIHYVKPAETLSEIATKYRLTEEKILKLFER